MINYAIFSLGWTVWRPSSNVALETPPRSPFRPLRRRSSIVAIVGFSTPRTVLPLSQTPINTQIQNQILLPNPKSNPLKTAAALSRWHRFNRNPRKEK
ncbi:hypothetical protein HanPI659440_Chr13g0482011 [Helianthus annuus]|nr:hypothetical protein HanPI659440_Chr13g0482011 [Helianthus annuus]